VPPPQFRLVGGEPQVREPLEELPERDFGFHLGELGAEAVVDAVAEADVAAGVTPQVETPGILVLGGVMVRGGGGDQDDLVFWDVNQVMVMGSAVNRMVAIATGPS
jgi:hypothetical protein